MLSWSSRTSRWCVGRRLSAIGDSLDDWDISTPRCPRCGETKMLGRDGWEHRQPSCEPIVVVVDKNTRR